MKNETMEVKKIHIEQSKASAQRATKDAKNRSTTKGQSYEKDTSRSPRPAWFDTFVGQKDIVNIIKTAITSSQKQHHALWHMLFSWPSGHGKTTLAGIIANTMGVGIKVVAWYAISKPSDMISLLSNLEEGAILFIDEIHRLKPSIEEILYIAMEEWAIDFVMPEWWSTRLPIHMFTLIGATTKLESLAAPLKNRFVYKFHFTDYTQEEIFLIIKNHILHYNITTTDVCIKNISTKVERTPREIHNISIKIRDYLIASGQETLSLQEKDRKNVEERIHIEAGGITSLHKKYLEILADHSEPVGIKTIAAKLNMHEKAIESDVEPLLLKLGKIEKTARGRTLAADCII